MTVTETQYKNAKKNQYLAGKKVSMYTTIIITSYN